jgi:hypothetical protein
MKNKIKITNKNNEQMTTQIRKKIYILTTKKNRKKTQEVLYGKKQNQPKTIKIH